MLYTYHDKTVFIPEHIANEDPETARQWNYTTADGIQVLMVNVDNQAYILCDREDAFLSICFESIRNGSGETMSRGDMEQRRPWTIR